MRLLQHAAEPRLAFSSADISAAPQKDLSVTSRTPVRMLIMGRFRYLSTAGSQSDRRLDLGLTQRSLVAFKR